MGAPLPESLRLLVASYGAAAPAAAVVVYVPAGALMVPTGRDLGREGWIRTRHAAAVRALVRRGLPPALAWWAAMALVGQWADETGWGRAEWDYALGNIRATPAWTGPVHYLQGSDDAQPAPYRAYASLDAGVEDAVRLAVDGARYAPAFHALLASGRAGGPYVVATEGRAVAFPIDVVRWHADLTRAGWHPYSEASQDTFRSTVTRVAQTVGAPPPEPPSRALPALAGGAAAAAALAAWWRWRR